MDTKELTRLMETAAALLKEKDLQDISVEMGEVRIHMSAKVSAVMPHFPPPHMPIATPYEMTAREAPKPAEPEKPAGNIVKSPIIGTFYSAGAPGKPPFVNVGDAVEKGQVVCIVESMKLMNEIVSDFSGKVAEIYAGDGGAVEFDQPLLRIV